MSARGWRLHADSVRRRQRRSRKLHRSSPDSSLRPPCRRRCAASLRTDHGLSGAAIAVEDIEMHFTGVSVLNGISFQVSPGRTPRPDRPQRRGEDDVFSTSCPASSGRAPGACCLRARTSRPHHAYKRARLGIGRTFQIGNLFNDVSVRDNIVLALLARHGYGLRLDRDLRAYGDLQKEASALVAEWRLDAPASMCP